jgi:hypothetical protein
MTATPSGSGDGAGQDADFVFAQCIAYTLGGSSDNPNCVRQREVIMDHLLSKLRAHVTAAIARETAQLRAALSEIRDTAIAMDDSLRSIPPKNCSVLLIEGPLRIKNRANEALV